MVARGIEWLTRQVDAQNGRRLLWSTVAFGGGCGAYFALKSEPPAWPLYAAAVAAIALAWAARRWRPGPIAYVAVLLAFFACGAAAARWRTEVVAAPVVHSNLGAVHIEGWVVDVVGSGVRGDKILLAPAYIDRLAPAQTPIRVRLVLNERAPTPGSAISVRAVLDPPPPQSSPGSHDFPRDFYFKSIGGVGLALGQVRDEDLGKPPWGLRLAMMVNRWRWIVANRVAEAAGPEVAGPAAAMTTGQDAFLTEEQRAAMRDAGLSHLLAIGGLHMGIVAGFMFFMSRLAVACVPWIALRFNGKKIAATVGLLTVGIYLLMSGAAPSAERAAITASTAFFAILLNRRAITFNALAYAALVILLLRPESIVGASFQMSFSATMALVALSEAWPHRIREIKAPWPILLVQRTGAWVGAGLLASFVAGAATGPFSIYQFNSTANFGVIGNALEMPISTFVTMPALAIGAVLETVGLGKPLLFIAGLGLEWTLAIGRWVSGLPHAVTTVATPPTIALPVSFLGVCFVCLWRGRLRWIGLPLAAAVFWWPKLPPPDLWIAADGANAAVRLGDHALPLRPRVKQFDVGMWSQRRALTLSHDAQEQVDHRFDCDRYACKAYPGATWRLSGWWGRKAPPDERLSGLCAGAEIVVVRSRIERLPAPCQHVLVVDGLDLARGGAMELWRRPEGWAALRAADLSGRRPWTGYRLSDDVEGVSGNGG